MKFFPSRFQFWPCHRSLPWPGLSGFGVGPHTNSCMSPAPVETPLPSSLSVCSRGRVETRRFQGSRMVHWCSTSGLVGQLSVMLPFLEPVVVTIGMSINPKTRSLHLGNEQHHNASAREDVRSPSSADVGVGQHTHSKNGLEGHLK